MHISQAEREIDYAGMRQWEAYFQFEPTFADRMELQMATLMHMLSGTLLKEAMSVEDFMVCPKKRVQTESKESKTRSIWNRLKTALESWKEDE